MQKRTIINLIMLFFCFIAYVTIRADAWRLLLFSGDARAVIIQVKEMNSDPHTTALKVRVNYTFTAADGKLYHGSGDRVLRKGENTSDLSWLPGTSVDVVYIISDPEVNDVGGREYSVLFPLVLVPFVLAIEALTSRRSRLNKEI